MYSRNSEKAVILEMAYRCLFNCDWTQFKRLRPDVPTGVKPEFDSTGRHCGSMSHISMQHTSSTSRKNLTRRRDFRIWVKKKNQKIPSVFCLFFRPTPINSSCYWFGQFILRISVELRSQNRFSSTYEVKATCGDVCLRAGQESLAVFSDRSEEHTSELQSQR